MNFLFETNDFIITVKTSTHYPGHEARSKRRDDDRRYMWDENLAFTLAEDDLSVKELATAYIWSIDLTPKKGGVTGTFEIPYRQIKDGVEAALNSTTCEEITFQEWLEADL